MKKTKVFLGWLSTGLSETSHLYLLRDLQDRYGESLELVLPDLCAHRMFHDRARNDVVDEFLASDCDILWFLDSDIIPPNHVLDLVAHHKDKWQIAGAPYPIYTMLPGTDQMSIQFTVYNKITTGSSDGNSRGIHLAECPEQGTEFVDGLATGCLFIKREVFEKLHKPYFEFKFEPLNRRIIEGEDLGFALKCHDLGIQFFVDYGMVCKHMKRVCLLDMQNYATYKSNEKTLEYDRLIREQVSGAIKAAYEKGKDDGKKLSKNDSFLHEKPKTKTGLLLPSHY